MRGQRQQGETGQQALGGQQAVPVPGAVRALPRMAGYSLAPQGAGLLVPGCRELGQFGAQWRRGERADHDAAGLQLLLHALHPDRRLAGVDPDGGDQLRPGDLAGGLQPPQREQRPVPLVQPAGGRGHLPALAGQSQLQNGQVHEIGRAVGPFRRLVQSDDGGLPGGGPPAAYLVHGDRHQPGAEGRRLPQIGQRLQDAQHGLLHHVVDVRMAVQRPSHDVVDQWQVGGDQLLLGLFVPGLGRLDGRRPVFLLHAHSFLFLRAYPWPPHTGDPARRPR
ncbi:hypothetical protein Srufu_077630 [Streptomyces libani subsp. rufus]|nr:hypothetical protein Srufu_077630 [Streptomyces libani subsp. rufus]